jgi:hypothetical protein
MYAVSVSAHGSTSCVILVGELGIIVNDRRVVLS